MKVTLSWLFLFLILMLTTTLSQDNSTKKTPNFIVIVADDMGFADMSNFGGDISTPNLDELANNGVRYTNFYTAPTCSPTRAMLLSGMDNHLSGIGNMYERMAPNQEGVDGYEGVLNNRIATLPEILKANGYHTYMAGKWHLGKEPEHIPHSKGFEKDFTILDAAGAHFSNKPNNNSLSNTQFTEDGNYLTDVPDDYYSSKTFTDKIIGYIESNRKDGKPFFSYLAFSAPHDPLQVPDDWLRKYKGKYDEGWDKIRDHRLERMKQLGIMPADVQKAPRLWFVPEFDDLTGVSQFVIARKMEIYAAMVEYMDMEIGRLISYLKSINELDNTYIIFFSDNGPESRDPVGSLKGKRSSAAAGWLGSTYKTDFPSWGRKGAHVAYGSPWAQVSATPFFFFKGTLNEGGVRSPLIVVSPNHTNAGQINNKAVLIVKDIAPTLLDIAGIQQPNHINGRDVLPMQGLSWASMINGKVNSPRTDNDWFGMEWWAGKMIRKGDWKLLWMPKSIGIDDWTLYNLRKDPGEQNDLSKVNPDKLNELVAHWDQYVVDNNIIIPDRTQFDGLEDNLPPRPPILLDNWPPPSEPNYGEVKEEDDEEE